MIKAVKNNAIYVVGTILFVLVGTLIILLNNKTQLHINMIPKHTDLLDVFFKYITYLGDGMITGLLLLMICAFLYSKHKWKAFLLAAMTMMITGIVVYVMKQIIFPDALRPALFIDKNLLQLVPGVEIHEKHSYPSGHTSAAFAFFALISHLFFQSRRALQVIPLMIAILVGYSRIYLSQHFLEDVVTGALIGMLSFVVAHLIFKQIVQKSTL
jgi:membrane-associated phospholipid phosphatase